MAEDIDYGAILESLNDKVDLSGSWGAPTTQYDDLTLGSAGTQYTAPADGYFTIDKTAGAANAWVGMENTTSGLIIIAHVPAAGNHNRMFIPAKKGQKIRVDYNATGSTNWFRFIYAQKTN